jgi:manganese/zinc/iron transport system ATP- binding protein
VFDWALVLNVRAIASGPVDEVIAPPVLARAYGSQAGDDDAEVLAWTS